jgi:8-amino-7-oxononanoate synthase
VHNSCHEGMRLSRAFARGGRASGRVASFAHNDMADLERKLRRVRAAIQSDGAHQDAHVFVVVESLYSMDGDTAPIADVLRLCDRFGASAVVDEAHSTGVYGPHGSGLTAAALAEEPHLSRALACCVYTFGKAMGAHGAVVCGSQVLVDYLVNYARSFVYTTAPPFDQLVAITAVHEFCSSRDAEAARRALVARIRYFQQAVRADTRVPRAALLDSDSPIQGVVFAGNRAVLRAAKELGARGVHVVPIRSPTVPRGAERLRVVLHAHNSEEEIDRLVAALADTFAAAGQEEALPASKL